MKKELKDYLHLYLGCDVMDDQGVIRELRGVDVHECCTLAYNDIGEESEIGADTIKPILRQLSDMTEDERLFMNIAPNTTDKEVADMLSVLNTSEFVYMLSKHFDLFNLIESGLAIDKKTLTPVK